MQIAQHNMINHGDRVLCVLYVACAFFIFLAFKSVMFSFPVFLSNQIDLIENDLV